MRYLTIVYIYIDIDIRDLDIYRCACYIRVKAKGIYELYCGIYLQILLDL